MDDSFYVDPIGLAGGLALWWSNDVHVSIIIHGEIFIDTKVSSSEDEWLLTLIYGPPYAEEKQDFWESIASLRSNNSEKWCLIGDTNIVASSEKKLGGLPFNAVQAKWYFYFMDSSCLLELPIKGGTFTWSNQRSEGEAILEKLDRILVSTNWISSFPKVTCVLDAAIASDHALIILLLKGMNKRCMKEFKFEAKWLLEDDCEAKVKDSWVPVVNCCKNLVFGRKLNKTRSKLRQWCRMKGRNNNLKEEEMKEQIKFLQGK
ncbi:hypothetical protein V6N12_050306 [Hibiscus sabdariffa]|uniref:Uncharacterized protein n=1 Tax=Hibiscus sabdariffa TaxID=183260 RepID=A0ABR2GD57_9ROSI